jgi:hypothetical protein
MLGDPWEIFIIHSRRECNELMDNSLPYNFSIKNVLAFESDITSAFFSFVLSKNRFANWVLHCSCIVSPEGCVQRNLNI